MDNLLHTLVTGFLVRADGWGPVSQAQVASWPKWILAASKFFNVWSCAILFTLLSLLYVQPLVALAYGAAFAVWRLPGFNGWQNWKEMYWRGLWPTAIGFTLISLAVQGTAWFGLASIPFAALYMLTYAGGYKWLPYNFYGLQLHVWIEHVSGWIFSIFTRGIVIVALAT